MFRIVIQTTKVSAKSVIQVCEVLLERCNYSLLKLSNIMLNCSSYCNHGLGETPFSAIYFESTLSINTFMMKISRYTLIEHISNNKLSVETVGF
jgi:hypothetical protein